MYLYIYKESYTDMKCAIIKSYQMALEWTLGELCSVTWYVDHRLLHSDKLGAKLNQEVHTVPEKTEICNFFSLWLYIEN